MCRKCHETKAGPLEDLTVLEATLLEACLMMALAVELGDVQSMMSVTPILRRLLKQHVTFSDNPESVNDLIDKLTAWKERAKLSQEPKLPDDIDWSKVAP